jgi:quinol monooxygenase YgiN
MNQNVISTLLSILNGQTVDFQGLAKTILNGVKTESNPDDLEKLKNMISIVKATKKNSILSQYIPSDVNEQSDRAIIVAEYCSQDELGDHLTDEQLGLVIDDLDDFIRQVEKSLSENLTEVLTKAGIRI